MRRRMMSGHSVGHESMKRPPKDSAVGVMQSIEDAIVGRDRRGEGTPQARARIGQGKHLDSAIRSPRPLDETSLHQFFRDPRDVGLVACESIG